MSVDKCSVNVTSTSTPIIVNFDDYYAQRHYGYPSDVPYPYKISQFLYAPIGIAVEVLVGAALSLALPDPVDRVRLRVPLTFAGRMLPFIPRDHDS